MHLSKNILKLLAVAAAVIIVAVFLAQKYWFSETTATDIATGNGRVEATEIAISAKNAGRVRELLVNEGDYVAAEQVVGYIESEALIAQLQQAEAEQRQAVK